MGFGGICLAARRSAAGQGFAAATLVGTGVHARRCWFRWAAWLGEQSVAPVAADGRHTNHCFESAAHRPTAAVRLSLHPGPSDTHTPGPVQLEPWGLSLQRAHHRHSALASPRCVRLRRRRANAAMLLLLLALQLRV